MLAGFFNYWHVSCFYPNQPRIFPDGVSEEGFPGAAKDGVPGVSEEGFPGAAKDGVPGVSEEGVPNRAFGVARGYLTRRARSGIPFFSLRGPRGRSLQPLFRI